MYGPLEVLHGWKRCAPAIAATSTKDSLAKDDYEMSFAGCYINNPDAQARVSVNIFYTIKIYRNRYSRIVPRCVSKNELVRVVVWAELSICDLLPQVVEQIRFLNQFVFESFSGNFNFCQQISAKIALETKRGQP